MAIDPKYVIKQAAETLHDPGFVRWTVPEMVRYFNDGCREVLVPRPDAAAANVELTLAAGAKQSLPANHVKLMDIRRNNNAAKLPISQCPMEMLDAVEPGWFAKAQSDTIQHFTFDPRTPREFYVYPPALNGTKVEAICCVPSADITPPTGPSDIEAVTGSSNLPTVMTNALINYLLYRAYARDSESASNVERARAYYDAFASSLGTEVSATVTVGPTSKPTPLSSS